MKGFRKLVAYFLVLAMVVTLTPAIEKATNVAAATAADGFHVSGTKLLDANGNEFIMRGINHAHTWYKNETPTALRAMAAAGCNTVRLVLSNGVQWSKDDLSSVKSLVDQCKKLNMVAVLEVHDATGKTSQDDLMKAADYFIEMKDAIIGNEAYVIVNIANEWEGTWATLNWQSGYVEAVKKLRDAGIKNTIMVDAAGWGQYPAAIVNGGKKVLEADVLGNTMFSTHMYEYAGGSASTVKSNIDSIAAKGLCQVIGEFGWKHSNGDVAEETIMSYCEEKGIGYLAWSWKGNSGGVEYLDLANDWAGTSLSDWGDEVVNGSNGLKATSKICSVFTGAAPTKTPEPTKEPASRPTSTPTPAPTATPINGAPTGEAPIVSNTPDDSFPEGGENIFSGHLSANSWTNVLELTTVKDGGTFNPDMITDNGYFLVTYEGDKDAFELVFQSWSGGAGWAEVKSANSKQLASGTYVSKITYQDIVSVYGDKFDALDRLYVKTTNGSIELYSVDFFWEDIPSVTSKPVVSEAPTVVPEESKEPSKEPTKAPEESKEPVVSVVPSTTAPVSGDSVTFFEGSKEVSAWQTALEIATVKNGGNLNPAVITEKSELQVTYTGTKDSIQVIYQSWTGGTGWAVVKPENIVECAAGSYTAVLDYATVTNAYGTSFDLLDRVYVQTQNGNIVLKKVAYVTEASTPVVTTKAPTQEPTAEPAKTPEPSVEPSKTPEPTPAVSDQPGQLKEATYVASAENVKVIGRTYVDANSQRWLTNTTSGIEFTFTGTKAAVTLVGDFLATGGSEANQARIAMYVDGERVVDDMVDDAEKTYEILTDSSAATHTVKVLKLSESASATVGIKDITVTAVGGIKPTANKAHRIEFIGDSITCGYGIDDEVKEHTFKNSTEDGTKTYAYKTAMALDADYSTVSVSGIGVISNYTSAGVKKDENVMPLYYDKVGYSWSAFGDWQSPAKLDWDFDQFQPEAIVINLGTNDSSYVAGDATRQAEFTEGYVAFIKQIRAKNPDATIFCTLGIMGADLYPQIKEAVAIYTAQTGDKNVTSMQFDQQNMYDGLCVDWHPSEKTNTKAAAKLTAYMKEVMGW